MQKIRQMCMRFWSMLTQQFAYETVSVTVNAPKEIAESLPEPLFEAVRKQDHTKISDCAKQMIFMDYCTMKAGLSTITIGGMPVQNIHQLVDYWNDSLSVNKSHRTYLRIIEKERKKFQNSTDPQG